jgi:hypothetical protein
MKNKLNIYLGDELIGKDVKDCEISFSKTIEVQFFEYPKHKPKIPEGVVFICVLAFTSKNNTLHEFIYNPKGRYIFNDMMDVGFEYEPYVTHWAYLPKKP